MLVYVLLVASGHKPVQQTDRPRITVLPEGPVPGPSVPPWRNLRLLPYVGSSLRFFQGVNTEGVRGRGVCGGGRGRRGGILGSTVLEKAVALRL